MDFSLISRLGLNLRQLNTSLFNVRTCRVVYFFNTRVFYKPGVPTINGEWQRRTGFKKHGQWTNRTEGWVTNGQDIANMLSTS